MAEKKKNPLDKPLLDYKLLFLSIAPILVVLGLQHQNVFQAWLKITRAQEISLTILVITATLWITELIPLFVTSFMVILMQIVWLLPTINADRTAEEALNKEIFLSPFFCNIILLFLGGFVLSAMLHKFSLDLRIARWILKKTGSKPSRVLLGIMLVSSILSMWMSNTATAAMMLAIVFPIISKIPETSKFSKALALAIPFACNLGGLGTPIGSPPNAIAMSYLEKAGIEISFFTWIVAAVPLMLVLLTFLWFLLLKLFPPGDLEIQFDHKESEKLNRRQYIIIAVFLITCLGWLTTRYHHMSTGVVSLFPIIVCFGFRLLDTNDFRGLSWDILFMLGGGLCLGVGLKSSGLTEAIVAMIPTEGGFVLIIFAILATVMTTFMSNTATANLIIPIAVSIGGDTSQLVLTIAIMCSTAMALPVSTPPNAIAFGSGILKAKNMIFPGFIISTVSLILVILAAPYLWELLRIFK